ncbi:hypothetical protein Micbo1qcDRAFT_6640 [Microdochium bolleyi]|uniref:BTB domain-containing protein n=1 Tax=Microdochium bolleyi TaxID=196109 RepID=A0A136JJC4_9PEZI|nr:hypothetical protein Micbo1qcDRAFT_6640 [Microdochium bolleyi]
MAPAKAPIARASMGHAQKPSISSRSVVPAIPLAMMPKKASKPPNGHTDNKAASRGGAISLDAVLTGQNSDKSELAKDEVALSSRSTASLSARPTNNGINETKLSQSESSSPPVRKLSESGAVRQVEGQANGPPNAPEGHANMPPALRNGQPTPGKSAIPTDMLGSATSSAQGDSYKDHEAPFLPPTNGSDHSGQQNAPFHRHHADHESADLRRLHHPRISNGGDIVFAGFPVSHTPSPAPISAGFPPPPHPPMSGGRPGIYHGPDHSHSSSIHNGVPLAVRLDVRPPPAPFQGYGQGQGLMPQSKHDNFSPNAARFGSPTPLSYHGSHASIDTVNNVELGGSYMASPGVPHPAHANANAPVGAHHPGPPFPPFMGPTMYNERSVVAEDQLMDSVDYFRAQFDNAELSDCTLELVYVDGRRPSVKLSGHKIILCRSPTIKQQAMVARRLSSVGSSIVVHSDDKFLRSDSWWMAVHRLYLHPLLSLPPLAENANNKVDFAGDSGDRFEFCLGYAAAGFLLKMQDVLLRGLHMASELLNWNTVETALAFVLANTRQRHTDYSADPDTVPRTHVETEYGYGPETRILMEAIINFLISAFPPNFELDPRVADPTAYARIPSLPTSSNASSPNDISHPAIARGSNAQHRSKPSRLGNIKFGDLPSTDTPDSQGAASQTSPYSSTLSRVLLNLPFDELRAVLCYGGNAAWKSVQLRARAIPAVIAAREDKRIRALEAIRNGTFSEARVIQQRLSANRRYAIIEPWDVLNWNEVTTFSDSGEAVGVARSWVPAFSAGTTTSNLPRMVEVPQSMV